MAEDQVFISYSQQDRVWLDRLVRMLDPWLRSKALSYWADTQILPGQRWEQELEQALRSSQVAVLLVSPEFLASEFIVNRQLAYFFRAAKDQGVTILWVLVKECLWEETWIEAYKPMLESGRSLEGLPKPEINGVLKQIAQQIKRAVVRRRSDPLRELPQGPTIHNLPHGGASEFVGRDQALVDLHQLLLREGRVAVAAVWGMGGIGKTELAIRYGWRHVDTYRGGICWIRCRSEDILTAIVEFAKTDLKLYLPENLALVEMVDRCWQQWPVGEVLLVLDDLVLIDREREKEIRGVIDRLPQRVRVLITTRENVGSAIPQLRLDVLDPEDALTLLRSLVRDRRMDREVEKAEEILGWLGYLPLAVELVGRYLFRNTSVSLAKMLDRLKRKGLDQLALRRPKREIGPTAQQGIRKAFELSWDLLEDPDREMACLLSLFALAPIPWDLVLLCYPDRDPEELEEIRDYGLVHLNVLQDRRDGSYQYHPLIRVFLRGKLEGLDRQNELKRAMVGGVIAVAKEIPEAITLTQVGDLELKIPHLAEVADHNLECLEEGELIRLFQGLGRFYEGQGIYAQAEL